MKTMMAAEPGARQPDCLTPEDVKRPKEDFFAGKNNECRYDHFTMGGGKIDAAMHCGKEARRKQTMPMAGTYSPDSYQDAHVDEDEGGGEHGRMTMNMRVEAQRIGECTGNERVTNGRELTRQWHAFRSCSTAAAARVAADPNIADKVAQALKHAGIDAEIELIEGGDCAVRCRGDCRARRPAADRRRRRRDDQRGRLGAGRHRDQARHPAAGNAQSFRARPRHPGGPRRSGEADRGRQATAASTSPR